jgi:YggT family protein
MIVCSSGNFVICFVEILVTVLTWAIIIRSLMSWFNPRGDNPLVLLLDNITEPILAPLRRIVPRLGMLDITPLVAILLMNAFQNILASVFR